jgi:hypothetical protein
VDLLPGALASEYTPRQQAAVFSEDRGSGSLQLMNRVLQVRALERRGTNNQPLLGKFLVRRGAGAVWLQVDGSEVGSTYLSRQRVEAFDVRQGRPGPQRICSHPMREPVRMESQNQFMPSRSRPNEQPVTFIKGPKTEG